MKTTQRIINEFEFVPDAEERQMAELLERAEKLFSSGTQKALYHPFKDRTEVDVWLADFEKFQKGK